jgi:hypothetical protein
MNMSAKSENSDYWALEKRQEILKQNNTFSRSFNRKKILFCLLSKFFCPTFRGK